MNNLSSYCGLVDAKTRASDKDLRVINGILFWLTVRKNCSKDREKLLKLEAEGWEFTKLLRSLEQWNSTLEPVSTGQHKITQNR